MKYILNKQGEPVPEPDIQKWGAFLKDMEARRVDRTCFNGGYVSTVFLGLDHSFTDDETPVLWETMIFGGPHDMYQDRYTSREDAVAGHAKAVKLAMTPITD